MRWAALIERVRATFNISFGQSPQFGRSCSKRTTMRISILDPLDRVGSPPMMKLVGKIQALSNWRDGISVPFTGENPSPTLTGAARAAARS
jgi:hypothetical protein